MEPLSSDDASDRHSERCGSYSPSADVSASDSSRYFSDRYFPAPFPSTVGELLLWEHKFNKRQPDLSEVEMMKERFAKLLLGEDMSGGGKGVCSALAVSNAITNLSATVFGELWRLEPLALQKKSMWRREMEWLLCVSDSIVDLIPTVQEFPGGGTFEVMVPCPRSDLYMNLPALKKLDAMLLGMLDGFRETEFCYVDRGVLVADGEVDGRGELPSPSFGRPSLRQEEKWWLPCPRVPLNGLSGDGRKRLQQCRDCASQILKAAMSINSGVLTEMELPEVYLEALPKRGKSCLGVTIYRYITADRFSPDCLLDCLDLSSEHHALEIANRVEAAINVWSLKDRKGHPHHSTPNKSSWGGKVKGFVSHGERNHFLIERAEGLLQSLRLRYPGLPQTDLDMNKIQYNKDVGQAILESYSRVLESLAFNIIARIDDLIYVDDATKRCAAAEGSMLKRGLGALPVQKRISPSLFTIENTPYASPFTTPSYCSPISPGRTPPSLSKGSLQGLHEVKLGKVASGEAQEKGCDPAAWAAHLSVALRDAAVPFPSPELAHVLIGFLCGDKNEPIAWKYIERAITAGLAPAMLVLALLSSRVIPRRHSRPVAYRLYMELLHRHGFSFAYQIKGSCFKKIMISVDEVLHLSQSFGTQTCEPGVLVVEFVFCIIWQLLDATLDDEGLLELTPDKKSKWATQPQYMEVDGEDNCDKGRIGSREKLRRINSVMAVELIGQFLHHKSISRLLFLALDNMPSHWGDFTLRLRLLVTNSVALRNSTLSPETLQNLVLNIPGNFGSEHKLSQHSEFCGVVLSGLRSSPGGHGSCRSSLWIPLDLYLEDCLDGSVAATNAIEILSGLLKALQAVNEATWQDSFLGLWMASLRLVQRERDPHEGPVPRLDTRLCMLLSITTLSIADIIKEEDAGLIDEAESTNRWKEKTVSGKCHKGLISSLQILGGYESLLVPPPAVIPAANLAAAKAILHVSGLPVGSGFMESANINDMLINYSGDLRHLIVEACISRDLLDTSAYFWPGYINGRISQIPHAMPGQVLGWSALMKGAPLTPPMVNALVSSPVSSLAELEKIYELAVNGSDEDALSAATVLCGASLIRGWNIQEHTVRCVMNLLSPPVPIDYSGNDSHLISHGPILNALLTGISSVDCVQIFSFHGLVPELAAALMAICEVFGSCGSNISWSLATGEEISAHAIFSNAFILLLRLWKFNHPPLEYCVMADGAPVGSQLTPEYLLLLRNSRLVTSTMNHDKHRQISTNTDPIFVDSFPKLKIWHRQHQACLASTLSGLVHGTPVHQNVDGILSMMFRKTSKGSIQSAGPGTSGTSTLSSSSSPSSEDNSCRPKLPAWDIMEAVPFVVDAALTACYHGRVSPRELATGLKDLADFLPASLATIVSYFSAEVTRGVWKPAFMNGTDWPSPAANLNTVEEHIRKIVAATGVDVPSLVEGGSSPATLPLPLAAFVSLTITYKLDKASERFLNLAGPALENLAASCPWPSMPIVAALWTQKVKRWSDFLVFSASRTVFHHNNDAVVQLLRSCFTAAIGLSATPISSNGGVGSLLGHGFGSHFSGGLSPVAPGILYLRSYRCIKDVILLGGHILSQFVLSVKEISESVVLIDTVEKPKKMSKYGRRYGQISFATAMTQVKVAAAVGATLMWLSGGSGLVHCLIREMLPSWFLSVHELDKKGVTGGVVHKLGGYALAYFAVLSGMFAWGIETTSKRRPRVITAHMEFMVSALDGKISPGCDWALWRAYVSGFLGLVVECAPVWVMEVEQGVLKRLSRGLRQWGEEELAIALLCRGGFGSMGAAAEAILT